MSTIKFSIARRIAALLNLSEDATIDGFFIRLIKKLEREIEAFQQKATVLKFNFDSAKKDLESKLEDAEEALTLAYEDVDITKIKSNADKDAFGEVYLANLDKHFIAVKRINTDLEALEEKFKKDSEDIQANIDSVQKRIDAISAQEEAAQ